MKKLDVPIYTREGLDLAGSYYYLNGFYVLCEEMGMAGVSWASAPVKGRRSFRVSNGLKHQKPGEEAAFLKEASLVGLYHEAKALVEDHQTHSINECEGSNGMSCELDDEDRGLLIRCKVAMSGVGEGYPIKDYLCEEDIVDAIKILVRAAREGFIG